MTNSTYHTPVLCFTAIEGLQIRPNGQYIDVTFGGGGHAREVLKKLNDKGRLLVFDQDPEAQENIPDDPRITFVKANFSFLKNFAKHYDFMRADGILADLGVSSHQFDTGEKGFSTRFSGPLDMRMNPKAEKSAQTVVNTYDAEGLMRIFKLYGELRNYRKLANELVETRKVHQFETTDQLVEVAEKVAPKGKKKHQYMAQVFQAIRIEVNDELKALQKMLQHSVEVLKPGGRLVVISYHSLEDRLVKNFFKRGSFEGEMHKDFYGNVIKPLNEVTRKPVTPSEKEIADNPRARSAKMRIAEKHGE